LQPVLLELDIIGSSIHMLYHWKQITISGIEFGCESLGEHLPYVLTNSKGNFYMQTDFSHLKRGWNE